MARPKNTFKPLLPQIKARPGRPTKPRAAIGLIGPDQEHATLTDLEQAFIIGQSIAKAKHNLFTSTTEGTPQIAAKGARDQAGIAIGFSPVSNLKIHLGNKLPSEGFDHLIFTALPPLKRDQRLIASLQALIIIPDAKYKKLPDLSDAQIGTPIGLLTRPDTPTIYVNQVIEQAQGLAAPMFYSQQGKKLVEDLVLYLKNHP